MSKELETVINFCLEHAPSAPVAKRVALYRGLAEFCGNLKKAAEFCRMADELEASEKRFQELALYFQPKGRSGDGDGHNGGAK